MVGKLVFKIPEHEGFNLDKPLKNCLLALRDLAKDYSLDLIVETGESVSPILISGDLELSKAELIRQEALSIVSKWVAR